MRYLFFIIFLYSISAFSQTTFFTGGNICATNEWRLVYNDEFNADTIDRTKWMTYYPCADWTENCEGSRVGDKDIHTDSNVVVSNGTLKLIAKKQTATWYSATRNYTSGVIWGKSTNRFMYGKFEIRCKIPSGKGFFPAFWLFGGTGNGTATEIDIFEIGGATPFHHKVGFIKYHEAEFLGEYQYAYDGVDFSLDFHTYSVEWDPFFITFTVDETEIFKASRLITIAGTDVKWCCVQPGLYNTQPFYPSGDHNMVGLVANLPVGSKKDEDDPDANTNFPSQFEIDYIRVYQRDTLADPDFTCEIFLYPNPSSTTLKVKKRRMSLLRIENIFGEILFTEKISTDETEVDVSNFRQGIYFVEVVSDDGTFASKFIKE
jgi:beta-glucanase (GH16 family)